MFKTGLSTNSKVICEELFVAYKNAGIVNMEISTSYDKYKELDYKKLSEFSKKYGINLWSFHLPFMPFEEIDISRTELCSHTLKYYAELIKKASDIGIDKFIIHPSGEPITDAERTIRLQCAKESLAYLSELAGKHGATIAVENLPRTCLGRDSQEIKELISAHSALCICFDTNHLLGENICDFITNVGDKIITTHISDYDFLNERHWLPGEGKVDWKTLVDTLVNVGYDGPWLYEVAFAAPPSIKRERDLVCEDFVRNANELFKNNEITVVGKPEPGLCSWREI